MEFSIFLVWYLTWFLLGIIGLPFTYLFFKNWQDKGYIFSKLVGLLFVGVPIWFFASFNILPFNELSVSLIFLVYLTISITLIKKLKITFNKVQIFEELVFLTVLVFTSLTRATNPRLEGTEKMMNIAIMNSIFRSEVFPPSDMWMAGETINYYYIGHFLYTFLSKLTSISTHFVYNLGISTIISHSFLGIFSIVFNLINKENKNFKNLFAVFFSILSGILVIFSGNLYFFIKLMVSIFRGENLEYFYPESTRIIPFTINEYPMYSFLVGDLHGHYISLPFFIMCIGIFSYIFIFVKNYASLFVYSFLAGPMVFILFGINSWDVITLSVLFVFVVLYKIFMFKKEDIVDIFKSIQNKKLKITRIFNALVDLINILLVFMLSGLFVILPFISNFKPPVGGIGIQYGESKITDLFLIWGGFFLLFLIFAFFKIFKKEFKKLKAENINFIYLLLFLSFSIIVGVEFVFLKDIFHYSNPDYYRANTVFKFYYHAWILLGISVSFLTFQILSYLNNKEFIKNKRNKVIRIIAFFLIFTIYLAKFSYGIRGIQDAYPILKTPHDYSYFTLDGTEFIRREFKGDYYAINFLNLEIRNQQPVILEAVGEAYTYFGRVSTFTGLPTVMGWPTHQWQWRNDSVVPFRRADEVKSFYESSNINESINFLKKYNVQYIYVGIKEKEKYQINYQMIESISTKIYDSFDTYIYKVNAL